MNGSGWETVVTIFLEDSALNSKFLSGTIGW